MKNFLLLVVFALSFVQLNAQCTPDPIYQDSSAGVYPPPFNPATMTGGLAIACQGEAYGFNVNVRVTDEITVPPSTTPVGLDFIEITGVTGLPTGFNYNCNPSDCIITPDVALGCINISGTTNAAVGMYPIGLTGTISTAIAPFDLEAVLPLLLDGLSYFIEVKPSGECVTHTVNVLKEELTLITAPNPFANSTNLNIYSNIQGEAIMTISDLAGKQVKGQTVDLINGLNTIEIDGSELPEGMYSLTLSNEEGFVSTKLMIVR